MPRKKAGGVMVSTPTAVNGTDGVRHATVLAPPGSFASSAPILAVPLSLPLAEPEVEAQVNGGSNGAGHDDELIPPPPPPPAHTARRAGRGSTKRAGRAKVEVEAEANGHDGPETTPRTNGAGPNGRSRRNVKIQSYAEAEEDGEGAEGDEQPAMPNGSGKRRRKVASPESDLSPMESDAGDDDGVVSATTPRKGRRATAGSAGSRRKGAAVKLEEEEGMSEDEEEVEETPKKKRKAGRTTPKKPTPKKSRILAPAEPEYDAEGNEVVKKKRKAKVYPKVVYDIPPVERLQTTFKGRLGYACLNTVLRANKPESIFCSRTCRIASIKEEGLELPKALALMNVRDLIKMIEWNEQNKIRFMRLSSEMFPFASHAEYGYDLSFADAELRAAGDLARKYGHRLTAHPGQFTQLGSPRAAVVTASVRELEYQCEMMDRMGLDQDGVMIIHMGGVFEDKKSTLARFKENYTTLLSDNIKKRLVLENDEICYNVDDIMPVCNELDIPIIFDYHHDWIYPSSRPPSELIPLIKQTWDKRGIRMKQHLSEPRPGAETVMEKRAHADRCQRLPPDLPDDVDLMIEAKDKEQAVFELYRIYGLEDVIWDNLRPPDPAPGLQTKGRKSSVKKKTKETGEVDEDGNPVELEDYEKEGDGGLGDEGIKGGRVMQPDEAVKEEVHEMEGGEVEEQGKVKGKGKGKGRAKGRKSDAVEGDGEPEGPSPAKKRGGKKVKVE